MLSNHWLYSLFQLVFYLCFFEHYLGAYSLSVYYWCYCCLKLLCAMGKSFVFKLFQYFDIVFHFSSKFSVLAFTWVVLIGEYAIRLLDFPGRNTVLIFQIVGNFVARLRHVNVLYCFSDLCEHRRLYWGIQCMGQAEFGSWLWYRGNEVRLTQVGLDWFAEYESWFRSGVWDSTGRAQLSKPGHWIWDLDYIWAFRCVQPH